jgi:membrane associated rhomboid family serine protease
LIPIGDDNRGRGTTPVVVIALIVVNLLVFFYELSLAGKSGDELQRFIFAWGARPYELAHMRDLAPTISYPVWVTVFTSMFMHGGWLHILGNMLYLWVFGDNIEDAMGHLKFLMFYVACGVGAVALQVLVSPNAMTPMVGASGAISGVLASYLLLFPRRGVRTLIFVFVFVTVITLPAILVIGFWIVLQFINSVGSLGPRTAQTDGVAYFAHVGGFATGVVLTLLLRAVGGLRRGGTRRAAGYY